MCDPDIAKKSAANHDYVECGKKGSKTRIQRIKEGKIKPHIFTKEEKEKISKANMGENNGMWKGDNVGKTSSLHRWIESHKKRPKYCECCREEPPYDLANISGLYKWDINDFEWLCRKCHMKKDGRLNTWQWHKQNLKKTWKSR
jgi:hypothetical protein